MKKGLFFLILIGTMMQVQAISKDDINRELAAAINNLNLEGLESASIPRQQQVVALWDNTVTKAKNFIRDNSMDLLKRTDSILMSDISKIEELNNDFTNAIKVIRATMPNPPISKLLQVSTNAKKLITQFQGQSFTLPSKKDALYILIAIATRIADSSKYLYGTLVAKK